MILKAAFKTEASGAIGNFAARFRLAAALSWERNVIPHDYSYGDSPHSYLILDHAGEVPPQQRGETKLLGGKIDE